jgi:RimJ/RimL family protein N-acetyltransferase
VKITIRPLTYWDTEYLRRLRNSQRKNFFDQRLVSDHEQQRWWTRYQYDPMLSMGTICMNNRPIGFFSIRLIVTGSPFEVYEIGNLLLDPEYQGRGIMLEALELMNCKATQPAFWVAHVKPGNKASLRMFEKAGFWRVPKAKHAKGGQ